MQRMNRGKHFKAIREKVLHSMDIWNGTACDAYAFRYSTTGRKIYGEYLFAKDAKEKGWTHIFSLISKEFFIL